MCRYQYINACVKSGRAVDLRIVKLSDQEVADRDAFIAFESKTRDNIMDYSTHLKEIHWTQQNARTHNLEWPFRIQLIGIENLPQVSQAGRSGHASLIMHHDRLWLMTMSP